MVDDRIRQTFSFSLLLLVCCCLGVGVDRAWPSVFFLFFLFSGEGAFCLGLEVWGGVCFFFWGGGAGRGTGGGDRGGLVGEREG